MRRLPAWKLRIAASAVLVLMTSAAYAVKDRDADSADTVPATTPRSTAPGGTAACPGGRFTDAKCQCGSGLTKKYLGNNQYECARAFRPELAQPCPSGRFNADQHPDCACRGGATKTYLGNNQYLCSATAGKPCPVAGVFTISGNQGCKCPADMRLDIKSGNQQAECVCSAADKKKWTDARQGTYCRTRIDCPLNASLDLMRDNLRFCDCPKGYVRVRATSRSDRCQKTAGQIACPVEQWFSRNSEWMECRCPDNLIRVDKGTTSICQPPSLGPVACPAGETFTSEGVYRDCTCPDGQRKLLAPTRPEDIGKGLALRSHCVRI